MVEQKAEAPHATADTLRELLEPGRSQERLSGSGETAQDEKRRPSVSRSRRSERQLKNLNVPGNISYTSPAKIIEIFNGAISAEHLCILSEMKGGSPSTVRKVMPQATAKQISQVVEL